MADLKDNKPAAPIRQLLIISCGTGDRRFLTRQALAALKSAELLIGTSALLKKMSPLTEGGRKAQASSAGEIRRLVEHAREKRIAILSEGDAGMGILGEGYSSLMDLRPVIIPGMSMPSYIALRTGIPYGDAAICDLRKKHTSLLPILENSRKVFARGNEKMQSYFREIIQAGYSSTAVYAVENPGQDSERIFRGTVTEAAGRGFSADSFFIFLRAVKSRRGSIGLSDHLFIEGSMDFSHEVRLAALASLMPAENDIIYCIGSGFGDLALEAALAASSGRVFAIEQNPDKIQVSRSYANKLGIRNIELIHGVVPEALAHLPAPDAVCLTCCKDELHDLLQIMISRNPKVRMTALTDDMDYAVKAADLMETMHFEASETMISLSRREKTGGAHCLRPEKPVFIVSGRRKTGADHG